MDNNKIILKCSGKGAINIALIKYWGKENEETIIPMNNSISVTLDTSEFCTETTVELYDNNEKDELILNGE
jgi:diphosphomevalonate decarboxylase